MGKKIRLRTLAVILAAVMTFTLTGCTAGTLLFNELTADEISSWQAKEPITQTPEMLGLANMKKVAESGGLTLYFHEATTEIAVATNDGTVWYSNPQNRLDMNTSLLSKYSSPFILSTIDSAETTKEVTAFEDSVKNGQFKIKQINNGIRVEYLFGRLVKVPLYPQVLTAERFAEIIKELEKSEQNNMKRYYLEVNFDTVTDEQAKKNLLGQYTKVSDVGHIFVLKQSPSALEIKRIEDYFKKINYTAEMRISDHELVGYVDENAPKGNFTLPVEYILENSALSVKIPVSDIHVTGNMKLDTLTVLPFLNTADGAADSTAIIPDGSGALSSLSKIRSGNTAEYEEGLYGPDYSLYRNNVTSVKKNLYLPVYGITTPSGAMLSVIESADATASISSSARVSNIDMGSVGAKFKLLNYAKVLLTSTDTETVNSYPDKSIEDDIKLRFSFLSKENSSWTAVAGKYRELLQESGVLTKSENKTLPIIANVIGAVDDKVPVMGIPREVILPLTTYNQALDIGKSLRELFPGQQILMKYSGWRKGGVKSAVVSKLDYESKLGSKKDFANLNSSLGQMNAVLFPDIDFQYVYKDKMFDGFSASNDIVRFITRESAVKPTYNKANFMPDSKGLFGYIYQPQLMPDKAARFLKGTSGEKLTAYSLGYMASDLSGNFSRKDFLTRNKAVAYSKEVMKQFQNSGMSIMSEGANAYALSYLDYALNLPQDSNPHPLLDKSVPFLQMVLSGSISYSAQALNSAADDRYYLLKCIETGSAINFTAIKADNSVVKDTAYSDLFNVNYDSIKGKVESIGKALSEALSEVYGEEIVSHKELSTGVIEVGYKNGKAVIVNYNSADAETPAGKVPAQGFIKAERSEG